MMKTGCINEQIVLIKRDRGGNMLLKKIEIRNVRKIKQAEIEFHGKGLQVIQGLNKSGKSTVGQAIALTLGGVKDAVPGMIKLGESKAEVVAYTNDGLKIRTTIDGQVKQEVSSLNEKSGYYEKVSGGVRTFLDSIRSGLEAPFSMKDWTDEDVIELIKERSGVSEKIEKIDKEIKMLEEERLLVGREKKAKGNPVPVAEAKHGKPIDELIKSKTEIRAKMDKKKQFYKDINYKIKSVSISDINSLEEYINQIQEALVVAREIEENETRRYTEEDIYKIDVEIAEWNKREAMANQYDAYIRTLEEINVLDEKYKNLTRMIEEKRLKRKETLNSMELGVKGLEITEDGKLLHNGVLRGITKTNPIGNWSTAQSLQVFFLLGLRFAGKIKVMVMDNAECLDELHTKIISDLASKHDFLLIMLKVGGIPKEWDEGVIYLREGAVLNNRKEKELF